VIVVSGSVPALPQALLQQLKVGGRLVGLDVDVVRLSVATLALVLLGGTAGGLALAVGCATGSKGLADGVAAGVGVASYLVANLAGIASWLEPARYASAFWYATDGREDILAAGRTLRNDRSTLITTMAVAVVVFVVLSTAVFFNPTGFQAVLDTAAGWWRAGGESIPAWQYLAGLAAYETLILVFGLVGLVWLIVRRQDLFAVYLGLWFAVMLIVTLISPVRPPTWPAVVLLPLTLLGGVVGGGVWGGIPGVLKARLGVNEILSTIMMNQIAVQLSNYLLRGPLIDPAEVAKGTQIAQSASLPIQIWLPRLVPRTLLHAGFVIALVMAVLVFVFLWRTIVGYRIRAVGLNPAASRFAGIPVPRYQALALILGGAFAGLAGAVEVLGVQHRMLEGLSGGYGFSGIVAALFGKLHPLGLIPSSILFGGLLVGADKMQRSTQVPSALIDTLLGLIVLFVVSSDFWIRYRQQRRRTNV